MNPTSATAALSGKLEAIPLFDVCQFLLLNRRTGTLSVRHGDRTIRVFFEEGSILDIADEGLRTGEKLLLTAVQWTRGTFAFDPTPPGIERRITESTEAILLEAARTIDEQRAREGTQGEGPGQETVFRERQIFAGELAEAFKAAVSGGSRLHGREDPVESLLGELAADPREAGRPVRPAYLTFGPAGAIACRGGAAARSIASALDPAELLRRFAIALPPRGASTFARFDERGRRFHVRARRGAMGLQVHLAALEEPSEIGTIDAGVAGELAPVAGIRDGLVLWSSEDLEAARGLLAAWLVETGGGDVSLLLEAAPRIWWERSPAILRHVGDPDAPPPLELLLDYAPARLIVDPARTPAAARIALEAAEAGLLTIAVVRAGSFEEAAARFERIAAEASPDGAGRLRDAMRGWVGVDPLVEGEPPRGAEASPAWRVHVLLAADGRDPTR